MLQLAELRPRFGAQHPYHYSCPLRYLKMVPEIEEGVNLEWRQGAQEYHASLSEKRAKRKALARAV